jgi:hypothetical protein
MNTRKWLIKNGTVIMTALVVLALAIGLTVRLSPHAKAQGPGPEEETQPRGETGVTTITSGAIPIQGRLTDASGTPLEGTYNLTFRLYDVESGGTPLCDDTNAVSFENGLFSSFVDDCYNDLTGQQVWLGVEVESDGEMTPRQPIYAIPYALSLRPGGVISDTRSDAVLDVVNYGSGAGVHAYSQSSSAVAGYSANGRGIYGFSNSGTAIYGESMSGRAVHGSSGSDAGVRGYSDSGCAVEGHGNVGAAICAEGSGVIQSSAKSYLWISGNGVRPYHQSDNTVIDLDSIGGAIITPGAATSARHVMLPITVPGPLYGQDVTISGLDIYWVGDTDMDAITDIRFRRQTGVCTACYVEILHDATDHTCYEDLNATGCTITYDLTSNNVLTESSGILYLTLQLTPIGDDTWLEIGGVRLTLEHD